LSLVTEQPNKGMVIGKGSPAAIGRELREVDSSKPPTSAMSDPSMSRFSRWWLFGQRPDEDLKDKLERIGALLEQATLEREHVRQQAEAALAETAALRKRLDVVEHPSVRNRARRCQADGCRRVFGFTRRHHCRRCGGSVCDSHFARPLCTACERATKQVVIGEAVALGSDSAVAAAREDAPQDEEAAAALITLSGQGSARDLDGKWVCVSCEGEMGDLLKEHGYGFVARASARAAGYGASPRLGAVQETSHDPATDASVVKETDPLGTRTMHLIADGVARENPTPFGTPMSIVTWEDGARGPFSSFKVVVLGSKLPMTSARTLRDWDTCVEEIECGGRHATRVWKRQ